MTSWIEALMPFVAGGVGAIATCALAQLGKRAAPPQNGWRQLRPSAMHWTGLVLGGGIFALCLYVRLFVGSARADAEFQMKVLTLLIAGFGLCIVVCSWQVRAIRRLNLHWRGQQIAFTGPAGQRLIRNMNQVAGMRRRWTGTIEVVFEDGTQIALDEHAKGAPELVGRIIEVGESLDPAGKLAAD